MPPVELLTSDQIRFVSPEKLIQHGYTGLTIAYKPIWVAPLDKLTGILNDPCSNGIILFGKDGDRSYPQRHDRDKVTLTSEPISPVGINKTAPFLPTFLTPLKITQNTLYKLRVEGIYIEGAQDNQHHFFPTETINTLTTASDIPTMTIEFKVSPSASCTFHLPSQKSIAFVRQQAIWGLTY